MSELIWLHPDCLTANNPAFAKYPQVPSLFVFDEEEIAEEEWTLKRIAFLYETLLELPAEIDRGKVVEKLLARRPSKIVTVSSVNPRFAQYVRALERAVKVEVLAAEPFVDCPANVDLKRFSRYWKRVEPMLF
ncbi:MAG: hypothetical protein FJW36_07185 [Acidobacteria bacterium]|nr:hypothetical protein [Acidobacteriota bacterium]